ncbi:MAG: hypothetical protein WAO58_02450 [Fimbriimonadaceae bacterium]
MKKTVAYLTFMFVSIGVVAWARIAGLSQDPTSIPFVKRQPSTPGTQENGHINVSGTIIGGQLVGGGAGLTGVNADLLDGLNSTAFLQSIPIPLTLIGTSNSWMIKAENATTAAGAASINGTATGATGNTYGGYFANSSTSGTGVLGISNSTSGTTYGVRGQSSSTSGSGAYGAAIATSGTTNGVWGRSTSPSGRGVYGEATAGTGFTTGVYGVSESPDGRGVFGGASDTTGVNIGVYGQTGSTSGRGVYGESFRSSGGGYGVYGQSAGISGVGIFGHATHTTGFVYGGRFEIETSGGGSAGAIGLANATTGQVYGVFGRSNSSTGRGVYGLTVALTGTNNGVYGQSDSTSGRGIFGESTATTGVNFGGRFENDSTSGRGVFGWATNGNGKGATYGVMGQSAATAGYGVYAVGDLGASGSKSFRIDHPSDPLGKYLLHYSTESPTPQNFYVGNVVTDSKGYAWVELPDYFQEINTNFKYQLTVVDDADSDSFVMAKVSKEIRGTRFQVRTSAPNIKVSWRVDADRNDLYVRNRKPKDVVEKVGEERGKYQHPELYGEGPERGMDYQPKEKGGGARGRPEARPGAKRGKP